jgi:general secretion pathway protein I
MSPRRPLPRVRGRRASGFTLLEVLVALTVVAIALGAGLRAAGVLTDNAQRLTEVTAAQWCAENELVTLRLAGRFPGIGEEEFVCEQLGRTYRGTLVTRATPNPNFRRVESRVANEQGHPLVTLTTVLGQR